ncbi:hypothetical protein [Hymenobacter defluvii]|uniref:PH domain-containing protein n=1 Tax=Hymenobacter defluvii TaxID=2054411 RepID=A0ABS3TF97_9BACT|nr:hypothetical protein [Hymenobacter defluvii]MBO3272331.1 hypothetical protein [Hymenobacter defluvii]
MKIRNRVIASQPKEKEVVIQAMYPLSASALAVKWAVYVGLVLLVIARPAQVEHWLNLHINSWPTMVLFLGVLLTLVTILLNYNYLFSRKTVFKIGESLYWQDQQGTQWTVPLKDVEVLAIQHSKKSKEVVLDMRSPQISTRVLLCEHWPLYTFTKRGYQATMRKVQEAFQHYPVLQEKATTHEVLYISHSSRML